MAQHPIAHGTIQARSPHHGPCDDVLMDMGGDAGTDEPHPLVLQGVGSVVPAAGYAGVTEDAPLTGEDFRVVISMSDIVSVRLFDQDVFNDFSTGMFSVRNRLPSRRRPNR